ncbi:MAG TPA: diaminopimelate epimerase [Bacillales bacterium]|nr:diaminopimelate epimerase [Bacillales bacterium]
MKAFPFTKMHGLGNCYVYVDGFGRELPESVFPDFAREVSDPSTGIGSDGLILILPSETADIQMRIFNKDGSEAKNCGNGLRCVAKYAYENDLVNGKSFMIETLGGLVQATVHVFGSEVDEVTVNMGVPSWKKQDLPMKTDAFAELINVPVSVDGVTASMTGVSMGNPHGVFFVDEIESAPVTQFGPVLADRHPLFPEGLNVEFVEMLSATEMNFRVWERGSGITQACGTGACAAVVAAVLNEKSKKDENVTVHLLGGDLAIQWRSSGEVFMRGPAVKICEGTYFRSGSRRL